MTFTPEPRELYVMVELQPALGPAKTTEHMVLGWQSQPTGQTVPLLFQSAHHGGAVGTLADLYATSSYEVRVLGYLTADAMRQKTEAVPTEDQQRVMADIVDRIRRGDVHPLPAPPPVSGTPCRAWVEYGGQHVMCSIGGEHDEHYGTTHQHSVTWAHASMDGFVNGIITTVLPLPHADHGLTEQVTMMFERAAWIQGYAAGQLDMDNGITYLDADRYRNPFGPRQTDPRDHPKRKTR